MATYTGQFHETFTVRAEPERVRAQFLDLDAIVAQFGDLETAEKLGDNTLRYLMREQNHGVFKFQGAYTCSYHEDGPNGARWASEGDGNIRTHGKLTVAPGVEAGTTLLDYQAEMSLDIDVNAMLAPVLEPVVKASIPGQMRDYVKRMIKAVEAGQ